ncbi:hypothetical protein P170DRAFT_427808 [Aspergillus steynii IBT 23096]|uniref:Uncharacterized protein n=1 Tax=Aspergillus steynii IBT 23096 TaxID=1392250 RepID=A0A2I2G0T0_9EURO|nr:uncharacterized protein P170DRAFT_427808 [Aspergillus steynii IBT 23096]PLB46490.1 hypothetical protein P170DRAFT_427808 [Aspergillus steynii IBT 23096]
MLEFARGTRAIQQNKWPRGGLRAPATSSGTPSPYGDDWDMLWLGFCGIDSREGERRFYIIPDDPTVPPVPRREDFKHPLLADNSQMQQARIVFDAVGGVCTSGFAVTCDAARKILAQLSMSPLNEPVDVAYGAMCDYKGPEDNFCCLAPYPPLISSWRQTGSSERDSDIYYTGDEWHEAYSEGIVYSTMLNAQRLANGERTFLAQWEEAEPLEIDPSDFVSPRGFLYEREIPDSRPTISNSVIPVDSTVTLGYTDSSVVSAAPSPTSIRHRSLNEDYL